MPNYVIVNIQGIDQKVGIMQYDQYCNNKVACGEAGSFMKTMPDSIVPLTVTSPPYADLRKYKGHGFDFEPIAKELWRVTADGGVLVWIVGDVMDKDSETGMPERQKLHFMDLGFKCHDTMIYRKQNYMPRRQRRYQQEFEYMYVFSKGKPKTFDPIKEKCRYAGVKSTGKYFEQPDTEIPYRASAKDGISKKIAEEKVIGNVWSHWVGNNTGEDQCMPDGDYHPARMPLKLAKDHIQSWSVKGDVVFDPMCGSGTTLLAANHLGRGYFGIDVSSEYVAFASKRLQLFSLPHGAAKMLV